MIKSILGGKSKNLCDLAYLLTLPLDKKFEGYGFWEVEISVEPNTAYTFSRENVNQINIRGATYIGIINRYDIPNGGNSHWLNHETLPGLCHQNVQITTGAEGKLWIFFSANVYKKWQNHENPFGYLQLEKGSTATEYVPYELTSYKSIMKVSDVCQLVDKSKIPTTRTISGVTFTNNGDGSVTVDGTSTHQYYSEIVIPIDGSVFIPGHVYLNGTTAGAFAGFVALYGPVAKDYLMAPQYIYTLPSGKDFNKFRYIIRVDKGKTANNYKCTPQLFDLTKMFGAGNEPKTVAEFKAKFPNDYYPYSPSCFVTSFDERMPCKTKNLFDINQADITQYDGYWGSNKNYRGHFYTLNVESGKTYTVSLEAYAPTHKSNSLCLSAQTGSYYTDGTRLLVLLIGNASRQYWYKHTGTFTIPEGVTQITFSTLVEVKIRNFQIEAGSTATDYVPYGYV